MTSPADILIEAGLIPGTGELTRRMLKEVAHTPMDEILEIGKLEADRIIETYKPIGKYWLMDGLTYVAIDNSTGDAWTEGFPNQADAVAWLKDTSLGAPGNGD